MREQVTESNFPNKIFKELKLFQFFENFQLLSATLKIKRNVFTCNTPLNENQIKSQVYYEIFKNSNSSEYKHFFAPKRPRNFHPSILYLTQSLKNTSISVMIASSLLKSSSLTKSSSALPSPQNSVDGKLYQYTNYLVPTYPHPYRISLQNND